MVERRDVLRGATALAAVSLTGGKADTARADDGALDLRSSACAHGPEYRGGRPTTDRWRPRPSRLGRPTRRWLGRRLRPPAEPSHLEPPGRPTRVGGGPRPARPGRGLGRLLPARPRRSSVARRARDLGEAPRPRIRGGGHPRPDPHGPRGAGPRASRDAPAPQRARRRARLLGGDLHAAAGVPRPGGKGPSVRRPRRPRPPPAGERRPYGFITDRLSASRGSRRLAEVASSRHERRPVGLSSHLTGAFARVYPRTPRTRAR
jgi:hypothetical protein